MAKQSAGLCGLDLMLDPAALATAAEPPADAPAVIVLAGDCPFVSRHLLHQLRDIFCPSEEDRSWAWREFSGDEQADPRDVLDEAATAPMFATATRVAVVRRADSFVSSARDLLERIANRPRGNRGLVILEVKSFPATTRLAKAVGRHGLQIDVSVPARFNLSGFQSFADSCRSILLQHGQKQMFHADVIVIQLFGFSLSPPEHGIEPLGYVSRFATPRRTASADFRKFADLGLQLPAQNF
jgi:hypothetical protein